MWERLLTRVFFNYRVGGLLPDDPLVARTTGPANDPLGIDHPDLGDTGVVDPGEDRFNFLVGRFGIGAGQLGGQGIVDVRRQLNLLLEVGEFLVFQLTHKNRPHHFERQHQHQRKDKGDFKVDRLVEFDFTVHDSGP